LSPRPVKAVVLTHWHADHHLGLSAIVAAWPKVEIIAHRNAAADIDTLLKAFPRAVSATYEAERVRSLGQVLTDLVKSELEKAVTPEEQRGWRAALIGNRALRLADVAGTRLVLPTRTVTDSLTLPDPDVPIVLHFMGRANTTGDLIAWLPRQRVVAVGDIVVEPVPFMINMFPTEYVTALGRISALPFDVLLPGHGRPQRDRALLDRLTLLVRDAATQVTALVRAGVATDSIAARVDVARHRAGFVGADPWLARWFAQYTVGPLIESVIQETRTGGPR
jgi:glyoxylase-like metal-dependent hydrolase (beta-lactamase superfamily II)